MCVSLVTFYFDERCEMWDLTSHVGFDSVHPWTFWFGSYPLVVPRWPWLVVVPVVCVGVCCSFLFALFYLQLLSLLLLRLDLYFLCSLF